MIHKFKVLRSSESTNGGFINAIETTTTIKVLDQNKTTSHVYAIKTDEPVEIGSEFDLDLDAFEIKSYKTEYINTKGQTIVGENKWLHTKLV